MPWLFIEFYWKYKKKNNYISSMSDIDFFY